MAQHGGYRPPVNPSPVSGPGAHSQRTDGGPAQAISAMPDLPYGMAGQEKADQRIAPMGGKPQLPNVPAMPASNAQQTAGGGGYQGGPFGAPSTRPNEPVTAGAALGPGPGPSITPVAPEQQTTGAMTQLLSQLQATDTTGVLANLLQQAQARGV